MPNPIRLLKSSISASEPGISPSAMAKSSNDRRDRASPDQPTTPWVRAVHQHAAGAPDRRRPVARAGPIGGANVERPPPPPQPRATIRPADAEKSRRRRECWNPGHRHLPPPALSLRRRTVRSPWRFARKRHPRYASSAPVCSFSLGGALRRATSCPRSTSGISVAERPGGGHDGAGFRHGVGHEDGASGSPPSSASLRPSCWVH